MKPSSRRCELAKARVALIFARGLLALALIGASAFASAATRTVTTLADAGPGSLRATIAAAQTDDTLVFAPGLSGTIRLASTLVIDTTLIIDGDHRITLDGGDAVGVMSISENGIATLRRLTFQRGLAEYGAGVDNNGRLTLDTCRVRDNHAYGSGGGMRHSGFALVVIDSDIDDNEAAYGGGGLFVSQGLWTTISGSRITGNQTGAPGGAGILFFSDDPLVVESSTIAGNSNIVPGQGLGGGVLVARGPAYFANSTISTNQAAKGGGLFIDPNSPWVRVFDSLLVRNQSHSEGGGIFLYGGRLELRNATFSGNTAQTNGGGLYLLSNMTSATADLRFSTFAGNGALGSGGGIDNVNGVLTLANSLIATNGAGLNGDISGAINSQGYNLVGAWGTSTGYVATDLPSGSAPMLAPLGFYGGPTNTQALLPSSAARDVVPASTCASVLTDQRGFARPPGQPCDIGAFDADAELLSEIAHVDGFE